MCNLLGVGRTSYYDWLKSKPNNTDKENKLLSKKIWNIFMENHCCYGARRIQHALKHEGVVISRRRAHKLMTSQGLFCKLKRKFKATTDSRHNLTIAPNILNQNFGATAPNQKYVGDITYIKTDEGWLYLATVIDLFSRKIVGWSMSSSMTSKLVNDALLMAIWKRKPPKGLVWHTDRGSQYASHSHREVLQEHGIIQSMSRKGNCWDNAVAESFFHTLKTELIYHMKFKSKEEAKQAIFEYIEIYYNRKRIHSTNNYLTPEAFERQAIN
jgi:transposase InsO family protein